MVGDKLISMTDTYLTSEAEEMYVITVARAIEDGVEPPVPVSTISGVLEVSSVSANQMIRKLEAAGLVSYVPYKGVTLTDRGDVLANTVLRNRRLWGRFLADHLGLAPAKADEVACEMEHVTPDMVANRLASFLGNPTTGPTGKPIPGGSRSVPASTGVLSDAGVGDLVTVVGVGSDHRAFLQSQGIEEDVEITVLGVGVDGSVLVQAPTGTMHLAMEVALSLEIARSA
jgi:DtxR family Mn-dependent transcriptional regulator